MDSMGFGRVCVGCYGGKCCQSTPIRTRRHVLIPHRLQMDQGKQRTGDRLQVTGKDGTGVGSRLQGTGNRSQQEITLGPSAWPASWSCLGMTNAWEYSDLQRWRGSTVILTSRRQNYGETAPASLVVACQTWRKADGLPRGTVPEPNNSLRLLNIRFSQRTARAVIHAKYIHPLTVGIDMKNDSVGVIDQVP